MSAAFSGPSRGLGIELYRGSQAYLQAINEAGGVHGQKLWILALDDGYNPDRAIDNTLRFIAEGRVLLLMNYVGTPTVTRILPLLRKNEDRNFFLFFPFTGAQPQRQPPYQEYVFNLRASYREETAGLVENFLKIGRKKIGIFYQIDAYGRSGWDGVRRALSAAGLKMVAESTYRRGARFAESMKTQVEILRKAGAEAVISVGSYEPCAAFIRDARDAGWNVPIANVSFVGSENLASTLLEHGRQNGRDYTLDLINSQVVPSYEDTSLPAVQEYRSLMSKYDPKPPVELLKETYSPLPYTFVSLEGFLNAKLLVSLLKSKDGIPSRARLKHVMENLGPIDLGIDSPALFSSQDHQGLHTIYYTTLKNEIFVPLTDWSRWKK
jgi:ABC-type branched-subunit amino acid transport system substrate-binding protein